MYLRNQWQLQLRNTYRNTIVQEHETAASHGQGTASAYEQEMTAAQELEDGSTLARAELHCSSMRTGTGDGCNAGTKYYCSSAGAGTVSCRAALESGIAAVKTGSLGIIGSLVY